MLKKILSPDVILVTIFVLSVFSLGVAGCSETSLTDVEYVQRAKDFQDKGEIRASIIELKNALRTNAKNAEARWLLGKAYIGVGDGTAAEKELRRAETLGIDRGGLIIPLAKSLLLQGDTSKLLSEIQPLASQSDQDKAETHALRGNAYFGNEQIDDAKKAFSVALELVPNLVTAQVGQARIAAVQGKLKEATSWLDKALAIDSDFAEAWSLVGDLKHYSQDHAKAEEAYGKAIAIRQNNGEAYLKRAIVRIYLADYEGAASDIKLLEKRIKNHPEVDYVKGYLFFNQKKYAKAQTAFDVVLSKAPDDMRAVYYQGIVHARQNHLEQAERYLNQFLNAFPNSVTTAKLLGTVRLSRGDYIGAESVLMSLLERHPNDVEILNLLGEAMLPQRKSKEATGYFRRVIAEQSDSAPAHVKLGLGLIMQKQYEAGIQALKIATKANPQLLSADYVTIQGYLKANEFDKAIEAAELLHKKQQDSPHPLTLMAGAYLAKGDKAKARELLLQALQISPGDPSAAANLARLELSKGNIDKARSLYEQILKHHPTHSETLVVLAQQEASQGHVKEAIARLEYAVRENPQKLRPRVVLASYYLRAGKPARVLSLVQEVSETVNTNPYLLGITGEAQLALNEVENAKVTFSKLVDLVPQSARAYYLLGNTHRLLNQLDNANQAFNQALKIKPDFFPAKLALARLNLRQNHIKEADKSIRKLVKTYPSQPGVLALHGELAMRQNRPKDAVETYQKALDLAPSSQFAMSLGAAQWQAGDKDGSLATYKKWLKESPLDAAVLFHLANSYLLLNRLDEAKSGFTKVVELSPDNALVLNNLAWLLRDEDPAKALAYAERALEIAPNNPLVMDTLGELLLSQGQTKRALRFFENATKNAPDNLDILYHLALALTKSDNKDRAQQILKAMLAKQKPFANKQAAESLANSLGG